MAKAHLIYNPNAGLVKVEYLIERAARKLENLGWSLTVKHTESGPHATSLAKEAAEAGVDALFVAGGDGSLENAMAGLIGSSTALGVLPVGTANVWAQELGLPLPKPLNPLALEQCAEQLSSGTVRAIDVGYCNESPFLLWAGIGLDAYLVHSIEPRKRWQKHLGKPYYATTAFAKATSYQGLRMDIKTDREHIVGHYLMAILSNIRLYAGGIATLSPSARLDDGLMELWLFHGKSFQDALGHIHDIWTARHLNSEMVGHHKLKKMTVRTNENLYIQVDGEPVKLENHIDIRIAQKQLNILVPPNTPKDLFSTPA